MSDYKYGDWYCVPSTTDEAEEIIRLAVKSGANNECCFIGDSDYAPYGVVGGVVGYDTIEGVKYTIEQLRKMFLDTANQWNGEGLPPVGSVCRLSEKTEFLSLKTGLITIKPTGTKVAIVGHATRVDNGWVCIVIQPVDDMDCGFSVGNHEMMVRPLITKRDKWIDRTIMFFYDESEKTRVILGEIYDTGLAKDIEE